MKLIPVHKLIKDKSLLMIDDSIVRGTQLRETTEFLYQQRCQGGAYPSGMSAASVWLQVPEFLPLQIRDGSDHKTCDRKA